MTDKELIYAMAAGSEKALYEISRRFSAYVCTVIRNTSGGTLSMQDTEELCSDVFFNLWKHRERLDSEIGLKPYLSVCARNAAKSRLRALKHPYEDIDELDIASDLDVERAAELNAMMRCLDRAVSEMSEQDRSVFLRYFFYGEKTAAIANAEGLSDGTVRSKLSRIRKKLREYLEQKGFNHV